MASEIPEGVARLAVMLAAATDTDTARAVMNEVTDLVAAGVQAGREAAARDIEANPPKSMTASLDVVVNGFTEYFARIARGSAVSCTQQIHTHCIGKQGCPCQHRVEPRTVIVLSRPNGNRPEITKEAP